MCSPTHWYNLLQLLALVGCRAQLSVVHGSNCSKKPSRASILRSEAMTYSYCTLDRKSPALL